jgi:hypothetical protein
VIQIVDWYLKFDTSTGVILLFKITIYATRMLNVVCFFFEKKTFHFLYLYLYNCFISLHAYICVHLSCVTLSLHLRWFTISVLLLRDKIDIYDDSTGWSWLLSEMSTFNTFPSIPYLHFWIDINFYCQHWCTIIYHSSGLSLISFTYQLLICYLFIIHT